MSTSSNARISADHSRRPSTTTSGPKSRVPSSRVGTKERRLSSGEVIPEDSASNPRHRRSASGTSKVNGSNRTISEQQTARVHLATRENLQVKTRSPVKPSPEDGAEDKIPSDLPSRQASRAAERPVPAPWKEKKVLCELRSIRMVNSSRYLC